MVGARHPALLLHGQPGGPRDWDPVVEKVAGRTRTLAITHPERAAALILLAPAANTRSLVPLDHILAAPVVGELLSAVGLDEIAAPTTIVAGMADRIVPSQSARQLADQIPGARLIELEGAHHLLHHERAVEVAEIIVSATEG